MKPLSELPAHAWADMAGVFTDIDDTLTTAGAMTPDALQALENLKTAGLHVIAVTGRPVGWSAPFALDWPLDAIVAENGAVALTGGADTDARNPPKNNHQNSLQRLSNKLKQLSKKYQTNHATRLQNHARLQAVAARVLREVPGATLAQDSAGRETDIAIDHSEFHHLDAAGIAQVVAIMHAEGLNATVSSIHINGWIGQHDKWQGACWAARELLGIDLATEQARWIYMGDSTNDQVMFQYFTHSVGVANIRRFEDQLQHRPRWVTQHARGAGFAEMAQRLLADRRCP
ncbi:HAD family hydrolase [Ottowia sp.]|uniref:HAD family hydrolase n=1 Tax=Ottowia sp. TaxID=1898956 RepID=UPI003A8967C7